MRARTLLPLLSLAAIAACVAPPRQPASVPAAAPPAIVTAPPPVPAADWRDWPRTPGDWHHAATGNHAVARYLGSDGAVLASLGCDRPARTLSLSVPGHGATALTIRTTSTTRSLPVAATAHADATAPVTLDATLAVTDPLLDAMAFSRGRFTIEQAGRPPLVLPAWAEVGRVIGDCRG